MKVMRKTDSCGRFVSQFVITLSMSVLLVLTIFVVPAYGLLTMTVELEDEEEGEFSLSDVQIEESEDPNIELRTLCNYNSACEFEFEEGGDNEFRYNKVDPSQRVLEGTLAMTYDKSEGGTETHFFDVRADLSVASRSTNADGDTQEDYTGDITFTPSDLLDTLLGGGEKLALGNANFTDDGGILQIKGF